MKIVAILPLTILLPFWGTRASLTVTPRMVNTSFQATTVASLPVMERHGESQKERPPVAEALVTETVARSGKTSEEETNLGGRNSEDIPPSMIDENGYPNVHLLAGPARTVEDISACVGGEVTIRLKVANSSRPRHVTDQYLVTARGIIEKVDPGIVLGRLLLTDRFVALGPYKGRVEYRGNVRRGNITLVISGLSKADNGLYSFTLWEPLDKKRFPLFSTTGTALRLHVYDTPLPKPMKLTVRIEGEDVVCSGPTDLGDAELVLRDARRRELARVTAPATNVSAHSSSEASTSFQCSLEGDARHCNDIPGTGFLTAYYYNSGPSGLKFATWLNIAPMLLLPFRILQNGIY